jgi:sigma-B regulation protein RsbU (phosphoserine phosphatase)
MFVHDFNTCYNKPAKKNEDNVNMASQRLSVFAQWVVKFIGVFLLVFSVLSVIQGVYTIRVSFSKGLFGFTYDGSASEKYMEITTIVPGSASEKAGLKPGDRVIKVNGRALEEINQDMAFADAVAGSQLAFTITRGDRELEIRMTRQLLPFVDRLLSVLYPLLLPLLMLAYVLVGLWGIHKHPSFITHLIGLVCFFFGIMIANVRVEQTVVTSPLSLHLYYYQIHAVLYALGLNLAPALWLFLFIHFPRKSALYMKYKKTITFLIFLFPAFFFAGGFFISYRNPVYRVFYILFLVYAFVYIFLGIFILSRGARFARKEENVLERRQYKLIRFGIKTGAIAIGLGFGSLVLYGLLYEGPSTYVGWITLFLFLVCQVVGLIVPFTFLNSFFQNKILETESALKRRLRYISASFVLFALYLAAAFLISRWLVAQFQLTDPGLIVFIVLVLALTFSPLHARLLRWLEDRLYPEKNRYKSALQEMLKQISGFIEESQILEKLTGWISNTMGIQSIYAVSIDMIGSTNIPLKIHSPRSVLAKVKDGSNFFWDEISEETGAMIDEEEIQWAQQQGISVSVPMISRGEPVGLLSIGKKKNAEDFTGDDLEIVREAASHTALVLQNVKLQMVHLEKKRIDKELEVAREIQNRLVPREIPEVRGLLIHGHYQPCYEVAGDYFDIIPLGEGRAVIVIADVSGKGAGAALLMSNLQAGLRMALAVSLPLEEIVYKINNLTYESSLSNQFITFFIGIWENSTGTLRYINAGHNPPTIIRNDDKIDTLPPTGIGLGIKKDQSHESREISLETGDSLFIFTDGIEEFFNEQGEAFGTERMIKCFRENKHLHPQDIIRKLFQRLEEFAGEEPASYSDDLTIIAARKVD